MLERSAEEIFAMHQTAKWLLRLMQGGITYSDAFFNCAGWTMSGIQNLARRLNTDLKAPAGRTRAATEARASIRNLLAMHPRRLDDGLESLYEENEILRDQIQELLRRYLEEAAALNICRGGNPLQKRLARLFGLDAKAAEFCFFVFAIGQYNCLESFFEDSIEIQRHANRHILGRALGLSAGEALEMQSALLGMGIVEREHRLSVRLTSRVERALLADGSRCLQTLFCRPLAKTTVAIEEFNIDAEKKRHALALMGVKSAQPAHLLLYGVPGSGKTSFACAIAQALGVKAWAVQCSEEDDTQDRRASLTACLKMAAANPGSLVLVDEAERLLDTRSGDSREVSAKAWVNELLERKNTRIIWITNRVSHLDPAVRRRFGFSIHFSNLGRAESLAMWNSVAARVGVEDRLPQEARERFARLYCVPVATMEMALRQARTHAGKKDFINWVERTLAAQITLQNNGTEPRAKVESGREYDADAVCAATPVGRFLKRAAILAEKLAKNPEEGMGTMLFYGPPGTGKSALARHLADILDKELITRRASDLLGPYVGLTEMQIASAFSEAEQKKALLLIDEADSFLFGRVGAEKSWEQTMVNEFLTQLETYRGICICTTNFRKSLDAAAMRRFALKMEFRYAGPDQLMRLYQRILEPLVGTPIDVESEKLLQAQKYLAPGDFKAVKMKMWLEDKPEHTQLVGALLEEQKLKLENEAKSMGF